MSKSLNFQLHFAPSVQVPRGGGQHIRQQGQAEGARDPKAGEATRSLCGHPASRATKVCSLKPQHQQIVTINMNYLDPEPGLCLREDLEDSLRPPPGQPLVAMKVGQEEKRRDPPRLKPRLLSQSL